MSTRIKLGTRIELQKRIPCFHCSRSLQYSPRLKRYLGFSVVSGDGIVRILHRRCIDMFGEIEDAILGLDYYEEERD